MSNNEFYLAVSVDFAPHDSLCAWCGKSAVQLLIDIGGKHHNDGGFFCLACGEEFTRAVRGSSGNTRVFEGKQMRLEVSPEEKYSSDALPVPLD